MFELPDDTSQVKLVQVQCLITSMQDKPTHYFESPLKLPSAVYMETYDLKH